MRPLSGSWRLLAGVVAIVYQNACANNFINLSFDETQYSEGEYWAYIPGWTVSYDGFVDTQRNPMRSDGSQRIAAGLFSNLSGAPNFAAVAPGAGFDVFERPDQLNNKYMELGHNTAWFDWKGGSYVSLSQTADLSLTDRYLWFYKDDGRNLMVLANGKPLLLTTGEPIRPAVGGIYYYPHTIADLSEFIGQSNVTLEFRYTTPVERISNYDGRGLSVHFDQLFFAPTNVPEPSAFALLGLGATGLWTLASARSKSSRSVVTTRRFGP